jgi:hypothetical protein
MHVGQTVLYLPDLRATIDAHDDLETIVLPDGKFQEMTPIHFALACRTVVHLDPFTVKSVVTGEEFEDSQELYIPAPPPPKE